MTFKILLLALLSCLTFSTRSLAQDKSTPDADRPKITISKETTYFTEPLNEHGEVDYWKALNAHYSKGVTPENNLANAFAKFTNPKFADGNTRKQFEDLLGLSENVINSQGIQSFVEYAQEEHSLSEREAMEIIGGYYRGPWERVLFPFVSTWIEEYSDKADIYIKEIANKTTYYEPFIQDNEDDSLRLFDSRMLDSSKMIRLLQSRFIHRLNQKDFDGCISDLLAIRKTAILYNCGPGEFQMHSARIMLWIAHDCEQILARNEKITSEKIKQYLTQRNAIKFEPVGKIKEMIDVYERSRALNIAVELKNGNFKTLNDRFPGEEKFMLVATMSSLRKKVDWDEVLKQINADLDRVCTAIKQPDTIAQLEAFDVFLKDWEQTHHVDGMVDMMKKMSSENMNDRVESAVMLCEVAADGLSIHRLVFEGLCKQKIQDTLAKIHLALFAYQKENGAFPAELKQLIPDYIDLVPVDAFSNSPFVYKKNGEHFLLYSVGVNQVDDGGEADFPKDDIAVSSKPGE